MHHGRVANFRRPNLAAVFLLVIGLLVSSAALTYWFGREASASNRKLTDLVFLAALIGNLALLFWAYRRIVDTVRVEEALRESEERFRLLFQQAAIGIKRLDLGEERMLEVNDRLCEILGYSRNELLKMSLAEFTHPDDLATERKGLERLVSGQIPYFTMEKRCLRKDGGVIWVRVTNSVPFAHDERASWWVSVVEEITERKRADAALLRTTTELTRSNQDLEQFAYVASHDLQEPLRMVAGYLQLLSERYRGQLDEKADKYIVYAVDGAERMSGLIHDLLAYSRVNIRGEQLQKTSAEDAFCFAMRNLASAIEQAGAVVYHDPLPTVRADKAQLSQLFQNLIGNAVKFHSPDRKAEIRISAREDDRFWHFVVQDNGIGFDEKYRDKMFLIFQRLQGRGKFPGTGIGLAICKRIVERHGGRIWANSRSGEGATFHFTIPVEKRTMIAQHNSLETIDILLVEDNPGDIDLTREALEEAKVLNRLHVVEDGEQALDFVFRRGLFTDAPRPDLILLDLNLPKRDGREVLEEIRSDPDMTEIPIVILTSSQAEEDIVRAYRLHANCYIAKPVNFVQFLKIIHAIEDFWLTIVKLPRGGHYREASHERC